VWILLTFLNILLSMPVNCNDLHFCTIIIFCWLTSRSEQWFIMKNSEHTCPRHLITNRKPTAIFTSIYQPMNAHIISHKTLLKHSDMSRPCQIIIRDLSALLNLCYSIHNSTGICKRGVVAAYHMLWSSG